MFEGTNVGGLSGIAYDAQRNVYYAVSDDRGELQSPRFYTLEIDVGLDGIGDVRVIGVTTLDSDLATPGVQPYDRNDSDLEDIVLTPDRELIISSERDLKGRPWLRRFALDGTLLGELLIPERFMPESRTGEDGRTVLVRGVRNNLALEGVALTADGNTLYVANEEALAQDGPIATPNDGTFVRILRYQSRQAGWQPESEVAYRVEKIFKAPEPATGPADNGVSAILAADQLWPEFQLLVMERAFSIGWGNDVVIYGVDLLGAQHTEGLPALPTPFTGPAAKKTPLVRMADVGVEADNLEGMAYGPVLANGKRSLIVISDDNFSLAGSVQVNQFLLFELDQTPTQPGPAPGVATVSPARPAAPSTPVAPAQVPASLPRTGGAILGTPLLVLALALLLIGLTLRKAEAPNIEQEVD